MARPLNMRAIHLGETGVARATRKADAARIAREAGWQVADVTLASNRFGEFWVVCQQVSETHYRFVRSGGGTVDLPIPRRVW